MGGRVLPVNGELIRRDREDFGLTRLAFLGKIADSTPVEISESTLRRAEEGYASRQSVKWISLALGHPPERYDYNNYSDGTKTAADLNGTWRVYYIEDDAGVAPYVVTERLHITQRGSEVSGVYEPYETEHPDNYVGSSSFLMAGYLAENFVFGRYFKDAVSFQQGAGVYQLLLLRSGAWAEGVCTFFADDGRIMAGLNIWIKEDSTQFSLMVKQAKRAMGQHKTLLRFPVSNNVD